MPRITPPLPESLCQAARRFAEWRDQRSGRAIPEELWALAADLASRHGVSRTARALRVQYYDLKKRVPPASGSSTPPGRSGGGASFVEILTTSSSGRSEVLVEFERRSGAKMRIRLKGAEGRVLADLSRVFLESRG
jgi:hypothetical protein